MGFYITGLLAAAPQQTESDRVLQNIIHELRKQLSVSASQKPELDLKRLNEFYQQRGFHPAWVDRNGTLPRANNFRDTLQTADRDGLDVKYYHPDLIAPLWNTLRPYQLAQLELLLTDAFFRYSVHLRAGRFQESDFHWDIAPPEVDPVATLRYLLTVNDFQSALHEIAPSHAGYLRLREALQTYRQLELNGGWPALPAGPVLQLGSRHPQVAILRQRLLAEGDLEFEVAQNDLFYDEAVKFAVEHFQVRHGLKMDGRVGADTRAIMNVTVSERIKQILFNMERWRWLPKKLGERYILVNVAGFELTVVENEEIQFGMGVIIGKPDRPTPVTSSKLHTIVFNPYWTLPPTIIFEDFLPQQQRDPTFFPSKQIRVFKNGEEMDPLKIDWKKVNRNYFPYILRQDPGPKNALGRIKFLFSNAYTVYLHDTPGKSLFDKESRALSSGCIRVEEPIQLASYLLGEDEGWTMDKVQQVIDSEEYIKQELPEMIPIYLLYMTTWADENRGVHFRPDIYDRDPKGQKCDDLPSK